MSVRWRYAFCARFCPSSEAWRSPLGSPLSAAWVSMKCSGFTSGLVSRCSVCPSPYWSRSLLESCLAPPQRPGFDGVDSFLVLQWCFCRKSLI